MGDRRVQVQVSVTEWVDGRQRTSFTVRMDGASNGLSDGERLTRALQFCAGITEEPADG